MPITLLPNTILVVFAYGHIMSSSESFRIHENVYVGVAKRRLPCSTMVHAYFIISALSGLKVLEKTYSGQNINILHLRLHE